MADFRGEKDERDVEVKVDLPVNAHIPHSYIDAERLRLQAYRQIAAADTEQKMAEAREELTDRYGELPEPVQNLLAVTALRQRARAAGIREIVVMGPKVRVVTDEQLPDSRQMRLGRVYPGSSQTLLPRPKSSPVGGIELVDAAMLEWCQQLIDTIFADVPGASRSAPE